MIRKHKFISIQT